MKVEKQVTRKTGGKEFKLFTIHNSAGARPKEWQLPQ